MEGGAMSSEVFLERSDKKKPIDFDISAFKEFIALDNEKKRLKKELKSIEEEMGSKEMTLIDMLIDNDMTRIPIGNRLLYINTTTVATVKDKKAAIEILKNTGYGDLIKEGFNHQQLNKLMRDIETEIFDDPEGETDFPVEFEGVITPFQVQSIRVRNA